MLSPQIPSPRWNQNNLACRLPSSEELMNRSCVFQRVLIDLYLYCPICKPSEQIAQCARNMLKAALQIKSSQGNVLLDHRPQIVNRHWFLSGRPNTEDDPLRSVSQKRERLRSQIAIRIQIRLNTMTIENLKSR